MIVIMMIIMIVISLIYVLPVLLLVIFFMKTNGTICYVPMGHCLLVALHTLLNRPEGRPGVSDVQPMSRISGCHLHPLFSFIFIFYLVQSLFLFCPIFCY